MGASGERTGVRLGEREWMDQVRAATARGRERTDTARRVLDLLTATAHARAALAETAATSPGAAHGPAAPPARPDTLAGVTAAPRPGDDDWTRRLHWATAEARRVFRS